ncbi:MAG: FAD-dependent oxidoreductase [bacterium]|nr:FAD-dependent oxidoreductase [bacterium]
MIRYTYMYDLIIIGGGPAGVAAGVYAARKKINTLLIAESFGGQSEVSAEIQNWIGDITISGFDLAQKLEKHVRAQEGIEIIVNDKVTRVTHGDDKLYAVSTEGGVTYRTKTLIVCSGSRRRKLGVPGEEDFNGRGVAYCATCDAPLFAGKDVVVVGGGNAGLEATLDLTQYANKIYLLVRGTILKGDQVTQDKVRAHKNIEVIFNAEIQEVQGDKDGKFVAGTDYKDTLEDKTKHLNVGGVFVEIGAVPNTEMVKELVELDGRGQIIIDHKTAATTREGIWAAGDATDAAYKQNNISMGDAVKAALSVHNYLQKLEK